MRVVQWPRLRQVTVGAGGLALILALAWAMPRIVLPGVPGDASWSRIQRDGVLRVGMDASYPPFEWIDDQGMFQGFDVELSRALSERWGVDVQFVNVHFDGLFDALASSKFDLIISALAHDRTMTQDLVYSYSYFNAGQVIIVRSGDDSIASVADLKGMLVAVELGAEGHQLARQLVRDRGLALEILPMREQHEVVEALTAGDADALFCDRVTAHGFLHGRDGLVVLDPPLTDAPYVIAAPFGATTVIQQVNEALIAWREDGYLAELEERWLGQEMR